MSDKPKYQLIEEVKSLERSNDLLHDERELMWEIVGGLVDQDHPTFTKIRIKIAEVWTAYDKEMWAILTDRKIEIEEKMGALGFIETTPDTMIYTLPGCEGRAFRVRSRPPGIVVQKSEHTETFDRWANSIESIYYLTQESGVDLIAWAMGKDEVR